MVVASGTSDRHVKSIADRVVQRCKEAGFRPYGHRGRARRRMGAARPAGRRAARDAAARARVLRAREALGGRRRGLRPRDPRGPTHADATASPPARACRPGSTPALRTTPDRLRGDYRLELVEIELGRARRGRRAAAPSRPRASACWRRPGRAPRWSRCRSAARALSTEQLARWLEERARLGEPLAFCIGGPDGLAPHGGSQGLPALVPVAPDPAARARAGGGGRGAVPRRDRDQGPALPPSLTVRAGRRWTARRRARFECRFGPLTGAEHASVSAPLHRRRRRPARGRRAGHRRRAAGARDRAAGRVRRPRRPLVARDAAGRGRGRLLPAQLPRRGAGQQVRLAARSSARSRAR